MADSKKQSPPGALDQRIDELESVLAAAQHGKTAVDAAAIPILDDEVVVPAVTPEPATEPAPEQKLTPRQLVELGQRLQQRVDSELNELAEVIRGIVKRCILEELRKELPHAGSPTTAKKPDTP
ncbi:MAG: hypothetical protein HYR49_05765 [Gammaproteobacteria bacterium]|nr:hypothetical protein [Gammaproteobacteria bacterium]